MKKISIIIAGCAVLAFAASCSDEQRLGDGQGKLVLTTTVNSDMEVVSRALADDLAASTRVWISNSRGLIRKYDSASELPAGAIDFVSGSYVAEGWAGDSVPASWDKRWFKAYVPFSVSRGNTTNVNMVLKIANTAASVVYDEGVAGVLKDISMTVGHTGGELVFAGEKAADRGYFMMPSDSHVLNYALKGTLESGAPFELTGAIADVKPATEYVLNVKYTNHEVTTGGGYFTIEIDDNPINIETQVEIVAPPAFSGYDFILGEGITAEPGKVGRRTVYITSASRIDAVELIADDLTGIISGNDVELFGMGEGVKAALEAAGINFSNNYNAEADNTIVQINFEEEFTGTLADGVHKFAFKATDREGRVGTATMTINVSNSAVTTVAVDDLSVYTTRAVLRGKISKEGIGSVGFRYRKAGDPDWTEVAVTPESYAIGTEFTYALEGLETGTTYEYAATTDGFADTPMEFTTEVAAQLPNASFEDWHMDGKVYLAFGEGGKKFWDSGNKGATTLGNSITTPGTEVFHSGTSSAQLLSKFIGLGIIGKFAAGNLFAGEYLETAGTDGVLGWGRPFASRPSAVKVWVKYRPGTQVSDKFNTGYLNGRSNDVGIIYVALTDGTTDEYKGSQWSVVVNTSAGNRRLFDRTEPRVIAYGEHVMETATSGEDMVQVTIPLDYARIDARPVNIIFVASASRYGDYFCGCEGSTMWLDDIELVY